ncbi:MAG: 1-deoxy-D-xylulose-5-phosphate synthase N-terminal domain-containing protein, partial [Methylovulum sp.]|nr:1-deoxy-D-xylulose-5-phosphate synthase N-terminal domain-containing protein [Methylovulum sp.]
MNTLNPYPLLNDIASPADVRKLPKELLKPLAKELREFLTQSVSVSGGHFSAGL